MSILGIVLVSTARGAVVPRSTTRGAVVPWSTTRGDQGYSTFLISCFVSLPRYQGTPCLVEGEGIRNKLRLSWTKLKIISARIFVEL